MARSFSVPSELSGRLKWLYDTGTGADVALVVQDDENASAPSPVVFEAHRCILVRLFARIPRIDAAWRA